MKMKKALSMLLIGALLVGTLSACTPAQQVQPVTPQPEPAAPVTPAAPALETPAPAPEEGATGSLIIATENETPSIAPARHASTAAAFKNSMTHNGLFRVDYDTLEPLPDLIESWRAISDVLFEFTLRQDIYFHNGDHMTAEDVVASLYYVKNYPEAALAQRSIVRAEVVDTYTLTIYTETPNSILFFDLAHQGNSIMPLSLIESGHDFTANPVGSGPFIFQEWRSGDSLTFTAFDNYFDTARASRIRDITWRVIPEGASRTIALEMGEVDYIVEVATMDIPRLEAEPGIDVFMRTATQHNALLINNENPIFSDINIRRALDMAIDKDAVVEVGMAGFAIPIYNQVPINFPGVSFENENSFDPEGAKALLAESGINPGDISFSIIASNDARARMVEVIQSNLADIGIDVYVVRMDLASFLAITSEGDYEAAIGNFAPTNLLAYMVGMLHSGAIGGQNRNRIDHPEMTALIDQAVVTIDADARLALFEEITKLANEHTGMVPLFQGMIIRAFNSNLAVPETSPAGALHINMMYWQ
ncbi:MAG: ABC transporter substrate-binding protein [Defluviitaleaceae bacterium]|nr:ABC transporter substrate-binding protein [Defluviitaleaceae bacterium]